MKQAGRGRPFQKGVSGNAGGKPRYSEISKAIRHILTLSVSEKFVPKTLAEKIAKQQIELAMTKGGLRSAEFIVSRAEGLPTATVRTSVDLTDAKMVIDILRPPSEGVTV